MRIDDVSCWDTRCDVERLFLMPMLFAWAAEYCLASVASVVRNVRLINWFPFLFPFYTHTHSLTHSLTHSRTQSLTHSLTNSLTHLMHRTHTFRLFSLPRRRSPPLPPGQIRVALRCSLPSAAQVLPSARVGLLQRWRCF